MTSMPITLEVFNTVFGDQVGTLLVEDPSSNAGIIIDWISEIILNNNPPELPLRVKNALRSFNPGNETLFNQSISHIRSEINKKGKEVQILISGSTDKVTSLNTLLGWIQSTTSNLDYCCQVLNLRHDQTILVQRAYNSAFQKVVLSHDIWNNLVKLSLQQGLFGSISITQVDLQKLQYISIALRNAGMMDECNELIMHLTHCNIEQYIKVNCANIWDRPILSALLSWVNDDLYPRISSVMLNTNANLQSRLVEVVKVELTKLRTRESFDIVIDYPDSKVALEEFRECLINNEQKSDLVNVFIQLCGKRLLHSGANTIDIISTYISTIRSFLIIDHRGVLLDKVCRPIREYLKLRDDTIQRIVFALLDTSPENKLMELAIELRNTKKHKTAIHEVERDLNWVPDPVDALPDFRKGVIEDIVGALISIFESKTVFVKEFVEVFSNQLLEIADYDVRSVYTKIKLLKDRFGKTEFSSLDVMIKDIYLSKKIDKEIAKDKVHASVLSHMYWPELPEEKFKVPEAIKQSLTNYENDFSNLKKGRKLTLFPSLGEVDLDIEFENGTTKNFKVSPDKAAIINYFQEQPPGGEVKLAMLCMGLGMPLKLVQYGLAFWVKQNVLIETGLNSYRVNE